MDTLLQHYEQELDRLCLAASETLTPEALAQGADECTEHDAESLLQSAALLNASMQRCIEENQREFRQALLQTLQPDSQQAVPASGVSGPKRMVGHPAPRSGPGR